MTEKKLKDLLRHKGDSFPVVFKVMTLDPEDGEQKVEDITGWTFVMLINNKPELVQGVPATTVPGTISVGTDGKVSFLVPGTFDVGTFYYQIRSTNLAGHVRTQGEGKLIVNNSF
jgi:hypothetical protein